MSEGMIRGVFIEGRSFRPKRWETRYLGYVLRLSRVSKNREWQCLVVHPDGKPHDRCGRDTDRATAVAVAMSVVRRLVRKQREAAQAAGTTSEVVDHAKSADNGT